MVACGACYDDGVHRMMAVVDAFLVESLLQFKRHIGDFVALFV